MTNTATIHVYLPNEATDCWRPVLAEHLEGDRFRIITAPPPEEVWEFQKGDVVHCERRRLSGDGGVISDCMVAVRRANN
jgi:hypothetical protein